MTGTSDKRILYLTQRFQPEQARLRGLPFVQAMRERDLKFEILTGFPFHPGKSVHEGYRQRHYQCDEIEGVTIHRSPLVVGHTSSSARRALSYSTLSATAAVNALRHVEPPDAVMTTLGPGPFASVAQFLASRFQCPLILDVQDLWPESLTASGMWPSFVPTKPIEWSLSKSYRAADTIICLSEGCREQLIERGADPMTTKARLNPHLEIEVTDEDHEGAERLLATLPKNYFCYTGNLGPLQGIDIMIKALKTQSGDTGLVIAGAGRDRSTLEALASDDDRITFVGHQTGGFARLLVKASLAAVMHLHATPLDNSAIPSKLGAYLGANVPVIVAAQGEAARLARSCDAGPTIAPGDVDEMAAAFALLQRSDPATRDRWSQNASEFAAEHLSEQRSFDAIAEAIRTTIDRYPEPGVRR